MFTQDQLNNLNQRHNQIKENLIEKRYLYLGILSEYQLISKNLTQEIVYTKLNPYQHFLFKRVLHGMNMYSREEAQKMHWDKKRRIRKVWQRAQNEINAWKQRVCNKIANNMLKVFHHSDLAKGIIEVPVNETDKFYNNTMSLKELDIKYEDVIIFFIGNGLLPKNFLELKCK